MYRIEQQHDMKIAYIGGGSRGWAWGLMSDLYLEKELAGEVVLYDIDQEAALANQKIANGIPDNNFRYTVAGSLRQALTGADFVIISILPGTFDEMESDVHAPEAYGIWQSVGDTAGPGGILRAMRTIPMYVEIARAIEQYAPSAWVINYTNPMSICVQTLYRVFPKIKAFGCCHEVFGHQKVMIAALREELGEIPIDRHELKTNILGLNHFTWIDKAYYKNVDAWPIYARFVDRYYETGYTKGDIAFSAMADFGGSTWRVRFDLFRRFGLIAAAGDRHLAEFCPGNWYLESPEKVREWGFFLTTVDRRREILAARLEKRAKLLAGMPFQAEPTGEEGVAQMKALMGLGDLVTNVNLPNRGQIGNLPAGRVVETNAYFTANHITPCIAGELPDAVHAMVARVSDEYEMVTASCLAGDLNGCLRAFCNDPLVTISHTRAEELFWKMANNTKAYLADYNF